MRINVMQSVFQPTIFLGQAKWRTRHIGNQFSRLQTKIQVKVNEAASKNFLQH